MLSLPHYVTFDSSLFWYLHVSFEETFSTTALIYVIRFTFRTFQMIFAFQQTIQHSSRFVIPGTSTCENTVPKECMCIRVNNI